MSLSTSPQEQGFKAEMLMTFLREDKFTGDANPVSEDLKKNGWEKYMAKSLPDGSRLDFQLPPKDKRAGFTMDKRTTQQVKDRNGATYDVELLARMWHINPDGTTGHEFLFLENGAVMVADVTSPKKESTSPVTRWQSETNWRVLAVKQGSVFLGEPLSRFEANNRPPDKKGILIPDYNKDNTVAIDQLMRFTKEFGMES